MAEYSLIKHDDWHLEECLKGSNKQKQMNIKPNEKKKKQSQIMNLAETFLMTVISGVVKPGCLKDSLHS